MTMEARPIRVLHVVGRMNRGGVETWLIHMLRAINRTSAEMDVFVNSGEVGAYDVEVEKLGSKIILGPGHRRLLRYCLSLWKALRSFERYDVVHSHVHHFSGLVLLVAFLAGVPVRIAHSHNSRAHGKVTLLRWCYLRAMELLIQTVATRGFACSVDSAVELFGVHWSRTARWRILYCSIDLSAYSNVVDRMKTRKDLGIPYGAKVVGHVGRFDPQKNHSFLLEIERELSTRDPLTVLLMVGDGPLRGETERKAINLGIRDRVIFAGLRNDVSNILLGAIDVFLMPSLFEGLPLVALEAQAAGLPLVITDTVTNEVGVCEALVSRMSLTQSPAQWADTVRVRLSEPQSTSNIGLIALKKSKFNAEIGAPDLLSEYANACLPLRG